MTTNYPMQSHDNDILRFEAVKASRGQFQFKTLISFGMVAAMIMMLLAPCASLAQEKPDEPEVLAQTEKQTEAKTEKQTEKPGKAVGSENDPDFAFMGEYAGTVSVVDKSKKKQNKTLALQVRAIGGNNFEAIHYWGGLPGVKGHRGEASKYIGRRLEDSLVLSGGQWAIFVLKDECRIVDHQGQKVGTLNRVERVSPTMGAKPPKGAIVMFDGTNVDQFTTASMTDAGLLKEGADFNPLFQDYNLHLEFRLPFMPDHQDQARSNSGCYLQSRYEVQVLDSFATEPVFNGCGSLYRTQTPDLNMCLPPLRWQTYDIMFTSPRWAADGTKLRNARITVWLNGVKVQNDLELTNKTGAGSEEAPILLPTKLQNHGDPVRFRNIWVIDRGIDGRTRFPIQGETAKEKKEAK